LLTYLLTHFSAVGWAGLFEDMPGIHHTWIPSRVLRALYKLVSVLVEVRVQGALAGQSISLDF